MRSRLLLLALSFSSFSYAQEKSILVFDLVNETKDSITNISYDNSILAESTNHNIGCFDSSVEVLDTDLPTSNLFPGSNFTRKERASSTFDLNSFPIRTSVKIFRVYSDSLGDLCSGSIISKRHVITAAHCVANFNTNELISDSIYVSPVFDNGEFNSNFKGSLVTKVYFFQDWSLQGEDLAILELAEPIGESTGWISIGFDAQDKRLTDGIFYKFSYPTSTDLILDPNEYNGDTLYYNYGLIDDISEHRLSIINGSGLGGESGSSIFKVENGEKYIAYGVLSFANNLSHSRINNWRFYAIKSIIENDLRIDFSNRGEDIIVYPNPTNDIVRVKQGADIEVVELVLFDRIGRVVRIQNNPNYCIALDLQDLPDGAYYLNIVTTKRVLTKSIIKSSE